MGNAGIAHPASPGNPLFNAAGLAYFTDDLPNISVSGTLISSSDASSNAFDKSNNSLTSQSVLSVASFPIGYGIRIAPFYSYPQNSEFYGYSDNTTSGTRERQFENVSLKQALGGLSYSGFFIPDVLAWGFSVGVTWNETDIHTSQLQEGAGSSRLTSTYDQKQRSQIELMPGLLWKATDELYLGMAVHLTPLEVFSTGTTFQQGQNSGSPTGEQDTRRYSPNLDKLIGVSLGQSFITNRFTFSTDLSYFEHEPLFNQSAWQAALGLKMPVINPVHLLSGFNYFRTRDYAQYILDGGLVVKRNTYEFLFGVTYKRIDSTNEAGFNLDSDALGFLFSSTISYSPF
ncbi:hypothetical protein DOE51_07555 [Bdellovibrio sp. NC01]|nr:hypothetical protein DOE51_07555 [Bdellovibrio sp. NC01]